MPVKGIKQVQQNVTKLLANIIGPITEKTMVEVLITGQAYAAAITPRDTSTLVNSQYRKLTPVSDGLIGRVGYAANYAQYVNDAKGTLTGKPRPGNRGVYWGPDGEPDFLRKGFERDGIDDIKSVIKRGYKI
ncbi:TPA: HK97 gp10 family phage protein [Escherichia coli]|nr:HK97 gp10 family phage protein [Escherichia coli]HDW3909799.1 HK97 gp10 family phage protein [Escherichia coli]